MKATIAWALQNQCPTFWGTCMNIYGEAGLLQACVVFFAVMLALGSACFIFYSFYSTRHKTKFIERGKGVCSFVQARTNDWLE